MKNYYVYIVTNASGTYYIGMTNNLERRTIEHALGKTYGFTAKYKIKYLLYYEETSDVGAALMREKQLKGRRRAKKANLIRLMNPKMQDLFESSFDLAQDDKGVVVAEEGKKKEALWGYSSQPIRQAQGSKLASNNNEGVLVMGKDRDDKEVAMVGVGDQNTIGLKPSRSGAIARGDLPVKNDKGIVLDRTVEVKYG